MPSGSGEAGLARLLLLGGAPQPLLLLGVLPRRKSGPARTKSSISIVVGRSPSCEGKRERGTHACLSSSSTSRPVASMSLLPSLSESSYCLRLTPMICQIVSRCLWLSDDCSPDDALRRRLRSRRRASSSDDDAESDEGDAERRRAAGLLDAVVPLRGLAPPAAAEPEPFERAPAASLPFEPARPDDDDDAALFLARMSRSISSIVRVSRLTVLSFCGAPLPTEAMRRWRVELPLAAGAGAEEGPAERERDDGRADAFGLASEEEEALVEEDEGREVDGLETAGELRGESLAPGDGREEDARCCALARANEPLDGSSSRKRAACLRRARSSRVSPAGSSFSLPLADEPLLLLDEVALDEEACKG